MRRRTKRQITKIELSIVTAPNRKPGALIQFPDGYLIMDDPDQLQDFILELGLLWKKLKAEVETHE